MMYLRSIPIWIALLCATACRPSLTQESVAGCYDVHLGDWASKLEVVGDSLLTSLPSRVLLENSPSPYKGDQERLSMRAAPRALPSVHPITYWVVDGDSVRVLWSTAFGGISATVRDEGESLVGQAESFSGFGSEVQNARLSLTPIDCASTPSLTLADQREIPSSLTFADGWVARLGESFLGGEDWRQSAPPHVFLRGKVEVVGVGVVDSVKVLTYGGGVLGSVNLKLPADFHVDALAQRLESRFGLPTTDVDLESPSGTQVQLVRWENRTHLFQLKKTLRPGRAWAVDLHLATRGRW